MRGREIKVFATFNDYDYWRVALDICPTTESKTEQEDYQYCFHAAYYSMYSVGVKFIL
jgi:hypothetical protein